MHLEDIRRGQHGWEPRDLPRRRRRGPLWTLISKAGVYLGRGLPVPTVLARNDEPGTSTAFKKGPDPVTVTGPVSELVLWVFGRSAVRDITYDGPEESVAELKVAERSV